jgi:hypothetical protein
MLVSVGMNYHYNLDFSQKLVIETHNLPWQPSPAVGVERIMLERESAESGRATSIVRYAPGAGFKEHTHYGGEEIYVLSGEFMDEFGVYPAGTYLRNPIGSKHTSGSSKGCVLLVKLGHFHPDDQQTVRINTNTEPWRPGHGGLKVMPLHSFETEGSALVKWPAGERFLPHRHLGEKRFLYSPESSSTSTPAIPRAHGFEARISRFITPTWKKRQ